MTKIISYNVNGIRAAIGKGFWEWMAGQNPDIICLQETKALRSDVDTAALEEMGYVHHWYSAEKKGYSGVATFSKKTPKLVQTGIGIDEYDREGRVLRTDFDDLTVLNCYFPSGTTGDVRQLVKYRFLEDIHTHVQALRKERPKLVILGDYNIAHREIDIHDPKSNKNTSGFLPEERAWMDKWLEGGFTDAYRHRHPEQVQYSWWSYRAGARANDKGWRIDYQCVSEALKADIQDAYQLKDALHSDHCPVVLQLSA
jgi:exodeoxyribonuclease III